MYCPKCGKEVGDANFCGYCGYNIESIHFEQPVTSQIIIDRKKDVYEKEIKENSKKMRKWKMALVVLLVLGIIGIVYMLIQESDYTDPFTKELVVNPEPYVGEEVTLILDKRKFFPDVDVWEQTRKSVTQRGRIVKYDGGYIIWWGASPRIVAFMNIGPSVDIKGAKAIKLTGVLERVENNEIVENVRGFENTIRLEGHFATISEDVRINYLGRSPLNADYKLEAYEVEPIY